MNEPASGSAGNPPPSPPAPLPTPPRPSARRRAPRFGWGRIAIAVVVLGAAGFGGYQLYTRVRPATAPAVAVQTAVAGRRAVVESVSLPGTVTATRQAKLSFAASSNGVSVSGKVLSVTVRTGDTVKSGQELARLDTTSLDLAVKTAQIALETARLKMQQLIANALPSDVASAEQSVLSASGTLQTAISTLTNAQTTLDGLQGRATASTQAAAVQQQVDALNAQQTRAQAEVQAVLDRVTATSGSATGLHTAIDDLVSGVTSRCSDIGNRDRCLTLGAAATDLRGLIAALDANTRATPAALAPSVDWFERLAAGNVEGLRGPVFRQVQAAAQLPARNAELNALVYSLGGTAGIPTGDTLANAVRARDAAKSSVEAAQAALNAARAKRDQLLAGPLPLDIQLQEQSISSAGISLQRALTDQQGAVLLAPFDGIVGAVTLNVGEPSGSGTSITLVDPKSLTVSATAQETDVVRLKSGQPVAVSFDAVTGASVRGQVSGVSPIATISQGVASYDVAITLAQVPPALQTALHVGMAATGVVEINRHENVLAVPTRAIHRSGRNQQVTVVENGVNTEVTVRVGVSDGQFTEIIEGLKEGAVVVLPSSGTAGTGSASRTGTATATNAAGTSGLGSGSGGPGGGFPPGPPPSGGAPGGARGGN